MCHLDAEILCRKALDHGQLSAWPAPCGPPRRLRAPAEAPAAGRQKSGSKPRSLSHERAVVKPLSCSAVHWRRPGSVLPASPIFQYGTILQAPTKMASTISLNLNENHSHPHKRRPGARLPFFQYVTIIHELDKKASVLLYNFLLDLFSYYVIVIVLYKLFRRIICYYLIRNQSIGK